MDLMRSEEHTSELQSLRHLVCRLLLEKKQQKNKNRITQTYADTTVLTPTHNGRHRGRRAGRMVLCPSVSLSVHFFLAVFFFLKSGAPPQFLPFPPPGPSPD